MKELMMLNHLFKEGNLSRRQFISRLSALGLTAASLPALMAHSSHAAVPSKGGRLRLAVSGGETSDTLDPAVVINIFMAMVTLQTRNFLVEIDHRSNVTPELATEWASSPDAARWTFQLRKGVEFHNGKTMDAEDVIFSINHHRKEKTKSAAKPIVDQITDIRADGKYAVVFELKEGNADFPFLMSDYHLQIIPAGTVDFEDGMGTGGYILQSFQPGYRAMTTRNPNYWKPGRAHFDEIETANINDVVARTNALKTGQVDIINRPDFKTVHLLEKDTSLNVVETAGTGHYTIPMLADREPFDNNDVRLGLKHALDRKKIVQSILQGHGTPGNDHPISPAYRYYAADLPQRTYDPDKARYYLKKAGLQDPTFKLHVSDSAFEGATDTALLYQEHARQAGINIDVVREPADGYWSEVYMKKGWCFSFWFGRPTEDWMLSIAYAADAPWNETHWKHERFNRLLKEARSELDESKRRQLYFEIQRIIRNEGSVVVPMFANDIMAATRKLNFDAVAPNYPLDGFKLTERWWFKS